ncbi:MAG TPA: hypothetical protein VIO32_05690, partial [Candidatus Baltobacteraceae bacterium]
MRLSQQPGWDAVTVNAGAKNPADAAAAVGAEIYVIGQYVPGTPAHVAGAAYRVATDERIADFSFDIAPGGGVPDSVTFNSILSQAAGDSVPSPSVADQSAASSIEPVVVPRNTVIVVALDHLVNSYSAASREPLSYTVAQDVIVNGHIIAKAGDEATGLVLEAQQGDQGGRWGIGWKAANLRVDVENVHNFCGDTIPMSFIRSEYRRRQGLFGSHQDLEIIKGQKYIASVARTTKVCGETSDEQPPALPTDALEPDDASIPPPASAPAAPTPDPLPSTEPHGEEANEVAAVSLTPPANWIAKQKPADAPDITTIAFWMPQQSDGETLSVVTQPVSAGMTASQYADLALRSLKNAVGAENVRAFRVERLCNGTVNGWYLESMTPGTSSFVAEQTLAVENGSSYVATYRRA